MAVMSGPANSMGLRISGITRDTPNPQAGEIVKGSDGEPNGILRNASQLLKGISQSEPYTEEDKLNALEKMLRLYAAAGLTAVGDRAEYSARRRDLGKAQSAGPASDTCRPDLETQRRSAGREHRPRHSAQSPWTTNKGDEWLKMGSFKLTLDGGQSVGTAYQRMPYGPFGRQLYGQTDPHARGTLFVEPEKLYQIFKAARDKGWQLTAHVQGGGAIDVLLGHVRTPRIGRLRLHLRAPT